MLRPDGRVVARNGEAQLRAVVEGNGLLHEAFAERAPAHDDRPVVVLESASHYLGGRGRAFVHEHHQRAFLELAQPPAE